MRIDELIQTLQAFRAKHGNMIVKVIGDDESTFGLHTAGEGETLFLDTTADDGEILE